MVRYDSAMHGIEGRFRSLVSEKPELLIVGIRLTACLYVCTGYETGLRGRRVQGEHDEAIDVGRKILYCR